jgi:hypothetical protein
MFGVIKKRKPLILSHWYVPLLNFESNAAEFYDALEKDLKEREVPNLRTERILFKEGGFFSANHEYLRLGRERAVLDICSAKFGKSWWFSVRGAVLPRRLTRLELILTILGFASFFLLYCMLFGTTIGAIVFGSTVLFMLGVFWTAGAWNGLDECLLWMPVIGVLYEGYGRKESYHRQDQRRMFAETVGTIVHAKVREYCALGGVTDPEIREVANPEQILNAKQLMKWHAKVTSED